jgi:hypothetical protein
MPFLAKHISIPPHLLLHLKRRIQCPLGMIFMRNGRSEQGKDAIAQGLRDIPFVAVHGVHHQLQSRIDNRSGLFGIESFDQCSRAFEIGKQRRDRLTLPLRQGRFADALGQMRGRVAG